MRINSACKKVFIRSKQLTNYEEKVCLISTLKKKVFLLNGRTMFLEIKCKLYHYFKYKQLIKLKAKHLQIHYIICPNLHCIC